MDPKSGNSRVSTGCGESCSTPSPIRTAGGTSRATARALRAEGEGRRLPRLYLAEKPLIHLRPLGQLDLLEPHASTEILDPPADMTVKNRGIRTQPGSHPPTISISGSLRQGETQPLNALIRS